MADDSLTRHMLFAQVEGPGHVGKPETYFDIVLSNIQQLTFHTTFTFLSSSPPGELRLGP